MTRQWMEFNINQYIAVRLTEAGIEFLRDEHTRFWQNAKEQGVVRQDYRPPAFCLPTPDEDGWYAFQGWDFMTKFAPVLRMGNDLSLYFKDSTDIRIEVTK